MPDILNAPETTSDPGSSSVGSMWAGVNPHLIARIRKIKREQKIDDSGIERTVWVDDMSVPELRCALVDSHLEMGLTWTGAFENSGTETQAPALTAMLQTNTLAPIVEAVAGNTGMFKELDKKAKEMFAMFEGRTGITKLNSTQVFTGMPPMKITGMLMLRAWSDPAKEVEAPLSQLMQWAMPEWLSPDGSVIGRVANNLQGVKSSEQSPLVDILMPSVAPTPVSLIFKGRRFPEMVFESVGIPLDSPIDRQGNFVHLRMPVTLTSLTALDKNDWQKMKL